MLAVVRVLRDQDDLTALRRTSNGVNTRLATAELLTIKQVADRAGVSYNTAYDSLRRLKQAGWAVCSIGWGTAGSRRRQSYRLSSAGRASIEPRFSRLLDGATGTHIPTLTPTAQRVFTLLRSGAPMSVPELTRLVSSPAAEVTRSAVSNVLRSWPDSAVTFAPDDRAGAGRPPVLWQLTAPAIRDGFEALVANPEARQVLAALTGSPASTDVLAKRLTHLKPGHLHRLLLALSKAQYLTRRAAAPDMWHWALDKKVLR